MNQTIEFFDLKVGLPIDVLRARLPVSWGAASSGVVRHDARPFVPVRRNGHAVREALALSPTLADAPAALSGLKAARLRYGLGRMVPRGFFPSAVRKSEPVETMRADSISCSCIVIRRI